MAHPDGVAVPAERTRPADSRETQAIVAGVAASTLAG